MQRPEVGEESGGESPGRSNFSRYTCGFGRAEWIKVNSGGEEDSRKGLSIRKCGGAVEWGRWVQ